MLVEAGLLALLKFLFLILNQLTIFVVLRNLFQETVLCALVHPGVAVEDVTAVSTVILTELLLEYFPKKFVRDANIGVGNDDFGPTVLRFG